MIDIVEGEVGRKADAYRGVRGYIGVEAIICSFNFIFRP